MSLKDMKIGARLGLLAGLLLLAVMVVGGQGWRTMSQSNDRSTLALERAQLFQTAVNTARLAQVDFKKQVQEWKDLLLRGNDPAMYDKYSAAFARQSDITQADLQALKGMFGKLGLDTAQVDEALKTHEKLRTDYVEALKQFDKANPESAHVVDAAVKGMDRPPTAKIDGIVATVLEQSKKMAEKSEADAAASYRTASFLLASVILLALGLGAATTYWIVLSITRPLNEAVKVAQTVAAGDLTSRIEVHSRDETGQLMDALMQMNDSLAKIVGEVRTSTDSIAAASAQIANGNLDLSSRTEEQASSLEETASSMEELTGTVKQNADNARQANSLAHSASEIAGRGGAVVGEVVNTMGSINESSKKIVDIIAVIDGIAFQTNILALNAAVEAARAGEQGRGFAVVASEVRNLAQRSAAAAKEIKELISSSVEKVDAGTRLVDQAGATMGEVVASVQRVADIIGEITAASQEQTTGIEQINVAITQMDDTTQRNASLVEEAAAAAAALQNQADRLANVVSIFKVGNQVMAMPPVDITPRAAAVTVGKRPALAGGMRRLH